MCQLVPILVIKTSCRGEAAATVCPAPLLPLWAPKRFAPPSRRRRTPTPNTFPRWPLQPHYASKPQWVKWPGDLDLWPFDPESGVRVTCDVGYLWPLLVFLGLSVLDLGPMYATDVRQTDVRQKHCLMPRLLGAGHKKNGKSTHKSNKAQ